MYIKCRSYPVYGNLCMYTYTKKMDLRSIYSSFEEMLTQLNPVYLILLLIKRIFYDKEIFKKLKKVNYFNFYVQVT